MYDVIVIGSGFGSSVAITKLASDKRLKGRKLRILVLERGTWWRNPEGPGLRSHSKKSAPPIEGKWQYWARPNDSLGLTYVANSIYKEHNPVWDAVNPLFRDNDLGPKKNRKGLYRLSRFEHANGNVDVVSGNAVGGGSLFYSGVNLIPHLTVLERIGLDHLSSADFRAAGEWMHRFRGKINKLNTKIPVPHYAPAPDQVSKRPEDFFQLTRIPGSKDLAQVVGYEQPNPDLEARADADYLLLDRARVLHRAMKRVGSFRDGGTVFEDRFEPIPLSVVEYDDQDQTDPAKPGDTKPSDSTKKNTFCTREGRCILGCLPSARHTLYKTIQKLQMDGADIAEITIRPLARVLHLSQVDGGYEVHYHSHLDEDEGPQAVTGTRVFLGAGVLGTTEILLRSKANGLPLSESIGSGFSTNGDFFGFTFDLGRDRDTSKIIEDPERIGNPNPTVGPINSSHFYVTYGDGPGRIDVNVEDAGIPSPFARLVHELLPREPGGGLDDYRTWIRLARNAVRILLGREPFSTSEAPDPEQRDQAAYQTERELVQDVFFYNLMGAGPSEPLGRFSLQPDGAGLDLAYDSPLAEWPVFARQEAIMEELTEAMGDADSKPRLWKSPFWTSKRKRVTVVHPLGGAPIGANGAAGAVDSTGRLFTGSSSEVHPGLYVVDAAAIPGALGVNPTFTIVAQAVRTVENAINEILGKNADDLKGQP